MKRPSLKRPSLYRGSSTLERASVIAAVVIAGTLLAWLLFIALPRWFASPQNPQQAAAPGTAAPAAAGKKIKARLFYVSETGLSLTAVERDVPFGENAAAQAREIINAQLAQPPDGMLSAVPPGTTLRALFLTDKGEAFVDFSSELARTHPGGSLNETLTVYTLVDALTVNLPAITSVQVLVDGRELETLAGHVDIRRPLVQNLAWVSNAGP
jgi:hypothetical protein